MLSIFQKLLLTSLLVMLVIYALPVESAETGAGNKTMNRRVFEPVIDGKWVGNGISYGAYRDGESPSAGSLTAKQHILEDLQLMSQRWQLIRMYGADSQAENILEVIETHDLPVRVMQGAWIAGNRDGDANESEIRNLVRLANRFPEIIVAVNVGNEIFVDWSAHRMNDMEKVIAYIRQVRSQVMQPVTVVDDYNFWNKPYARLIADEVDFIGLNAYAFWNNMTIEQALEWTVSTYRDIDSRYPEHLTVFTETGWPSNRVYDDGSYEGTLTGKADETVQCRFFEQYDAWVEANRINSFYFEAFDERWKGGDDGENAADKAEKHWGVYHADRTPKRLLVADNACTGPGAPDIVN